MKYKVKIESEFEIDFPDGGDFEDIDIVKDWIWRSTTHAAVQYTNMMGISHMADSIKNSGGKECHPLVKFHIDKDNEISKKVDDNFKIEVKKV